MLKKKLIAVTISLATMVWSAQAQEKYSKVRIAVPTEQSRKLVVHNLALDHFMEEEYAITAELSTSELAKLKSLSISYQVLVDDVSRHFVEESKKFFAAAKKAKVTKLPQQQLRMAFDQSGKTVSNMIATPSMFTTTSTPPGGMGGYYTYAEMNTEMNDLVTAFPSLVQKFSIGKSVENRDLWCIKISDNVATDDNEPEVLYLGLQHAREAITGTSLIFFAQYLAQNYASDPQVKALVDNREIYIIPCVNPDGYEYNRSTNPSGGGMTRKNRKLVDDRGGTNNDVYGVDLNRNYGQDWGNCPANDASCGSNTPSDETYYGTSAFSEPETQAVRDLCFTRNFVAAFDQHCSGPYYSLPFGRRSLHTMGTLDQKFYSYIPALMGKYNGHRAGDSKATVAYEVAGGAKDWWLLGDIETFPGEANKKGKIYGMTGEAGGGGFWAPSSQIIELCKNLCFQNLQLAYAAGTLVDFQDKSDIAVSSLTGNFDFSMRRVGIGNEPVTVSLVPIENIQSYGTSITVNGFTNYYDSVNRSINYSLNPAIANGQRIRFVWKVEMGGVTLYDTVTKFFNPQVLLSDDMEGSLATNWTGNLWDFTNSSAYSGAKSLAESPIGNYTSLSTRTVTYNSTFNLTNATATYLSFWVKHRSENFRDKLQIQVSANGGTWTALHGINTVMESNTTNGGSLGNQPALTGIREEWTRELIDLEAYKGVANLSLRFQFTSDGDNSNFEKELDDGFYIDDLKMVMSTAVLSPLPVNFISFNGKLLQDKTVQLWWEAQTDEEHHYFDVERSSDGVRFTSLGKSNPLPPYRFIDVNPVAGSNFYRIKQVDKDGKITYSKTIAISLEQEVRVVLYPNPVSDVLHIMLKVESPELVTVKITDLQGKEVYRIPTTTLTGNDVKVDVSTWKSQFYIITLYNGKKEVVATQKFVKH